MVDITKQDMTDIWAVAGDVVAPDSAKVRAGWAVEAVPRQWWNWFENRQDTNIAYMLQKGIPEWDQFTEYLTNRSYVQRNNIVYKCILTGVNKDPTSQPTYWVKAFPESSAYLETIRPLAVSNDSMAYIDGSGVAQNTPTTSFGRSGLNVADAAAARTLYAAQQSNSNLSALSSVVGATNALPYFTGTAAMAVTTLTSFGRSLIDDADATAARLTLGLNLVDNTSDVNKPISSATSTALAGKQPLDATLSALAGVTTSADTITYFTGVDLVSQTGLTSFGRSLIDDTDAPTARTTLGLGNVDNTSDASKPLSTAAVTALAGKQPLDATLTAIGGVTSSADTLMYFTGVDTVSTTALTSFSRSLLDDADAATARATLSAAKSGANSDITSISGLTTALSISQGGTGATTVAQALINLGIVQSSLTQIEGLIVRRTSPGVITVGTGSAYVPSEGKSLVLLSPVTINLSGLTAGSFYNIYLYNNAGTPAIELSGANPEEYQFPAHRKFSDNTRRYVGSILANSASDCYMFDMHNDRVLYTVNSAAADPNFFVVSSARPITSTAISTVSFVPTTGRSALCHLGNNHNAGATARFGVSTLGATTTTNWTFALDALAGGNFCEAELQLDSSRQFTLMVDATGASGGVFVRGRGYTFYR